MTSLPERRGSFDKLGLDYYKFPLTYFGLHIFKNQFDGFLDVLHGLFFRLALSYGRWQFFALSDIVAVLTLTDLDVIH